MPQITGWKKRFGRSRDHSSIVQARISIFDRRGVGLEMFAESSYEGDSEMMISIDQWLPEYSGIH
jgi:hypothetical protein